MIAVVDYGVNNLKSVQRALVAGGHAAELVSDPDVVRQADRVLVPGVGHYQRACRTLTETGLGEAILEVAGRGRPVMGICLGLQLFFAESEEAPTVAGLGLLPGKVVKFRTELPVPHVGWAEVTATPSGEASRWLGPLFHGVPQFFYHVHSYHPDALPADSVLATADYGEVFPTIVGRDNVVGAQFHPEKSQAAGIALLSAFAEWTP